VDLYSRYRIAPLKCRAVRTVRGLRSAMSQPVTPYSTAVRRLSTASRPPPGGPTPRFRGGRPPQMFRSERLCRRIVRLVAMPTRERVPASGPRAVASSGGIWSRRLRPTAFGPSLPSGPGPEGGAAERGLEARDPGRDDNSVGPLPGRRPSDQIGPSDDVASAVVDERRIPASSALAHPQRTHHVRLRWARGCVLGLLAPRRRLQCPGV
jgi:hypothetical protein